MRQHSYVSRAIDECALWGIPVHIVKDIPFEMQSPGDDGVGLDWDRQRVFIEERVLHLGSKGPGLLHELSHVIFPENAQRIDEIDSGMLAFEYHTAKRLGFESSWDEWMAPYTMTDGGAWSHSSRYRRKKDLELARRAANRVGILDNTVPTYRAARGGRR